MEVAQVPQKLYVDVTVKGEGHTGRAVVRDLHTNVVLVQQDGETTLDKTNAAAQSPDGRDLVPPEEIAAFLTVKSIWDYCTEELDPLHDPIDIIRSAVKVNTAISEEGLSKEYGLAIGRNLELATGCTEPGAVALTAAEAGCALRRAGANTVEEVLVSASVNIIKNAMSAGIPGTSYEGMDYAAAIGAVGGEPVHLLEVMNYVAPEQVEQAAALVKAGKVKVEVAQVPQKLYVDVTVKGEGHTGRAVVRDLHTNVVLVQQDGETTLDKTNAAAQSPDGRDLVPPEEIAAFLTVKSIWDYCTEELDPLHDPIDIIRSAVKVNTAISEEGLSKEYGLAIGRNLELNCRKGLMTRDLTTNAMIIASAGADARMAGAPVSVVANSGSGNQGITATMPVVAAARWLDINEEKMLRAVTLSNLIAIRIKSKFGRLSNLCGATVAGTGAACGITYLLGGGYHEICCAIQNMVGNVTGMVCDGAKADCALKISTCVNAACQAAAMGTRGIRVQSTDGIIEDNVEYTLDNFATLSTHGTSDKVILDLMLNKHLPEAE